MRTFTCRSTFLYGPMGTLQDIMKPNYERTVSLRFLGTVCNAFITCAKISITVNYVSQFWANIKKSKSFLAFQTGWNGKKTSHATVPSRNPDIVFSKRQAHPEAKFLNKQFITLRPPLSVKSSGSPNAALDCLHMASVIESVVSTPGRA